MMEFFKNMWMWIVENRDVITTVMTSSTFMSIVALVYTYFKNKKSVDKNTLSLNSIQTMFTKTDNDSKEIKALGDGLTKVHSIIDKCDTAIQHVENKFSELQTSFNSKINAILEVQTIVYSTIKDDSLRNAVNSILINAKYDDVATKAKLEKEITELKQKVANTLSDVDAAVNETVDKVNAMVTGLPTENDAETLEVVRY